MLGGERRCRHTGFAASGRVCVFTAWLHITSLIYPPHSSPPCPTASWRVFFPDHAQLNNKMSSHTSAAIVGFVRTNVVLTAKATEQILWTLNASPHSRDAGFQNSFWNICWSNVDVQLFHLLLCSFCLYTMIHTDRKLKIIQCEVNYKVGLQKRTNSHKPTAVRSVWLWV